MGGLGNFGRVIPGTRLDLRIPGKNKSGIALCWSLLLATLAACHGGCKQCGEVTSDFSSALAACSLEGCLQTYPDDCCGAVPSEPDACEKKPCEAAASHLSPVRKCSIWPFFKSKTTAKAKAKLAAKQRPEPVIAYEPPRPPKFLLVPTQEVFSRVNMMAPMPRRGDVEVGFGPQIDIPGHD